MTRIKETPKPKPLSVEEFGGTKENQNQTDGAFAYAIAASNMRVNDNNDLEQRDGTLETISTLGLGPVLGAGRISIDVGELYNAFDLHCASSAIDDTFSDDWSRDSDSLTLVNTQSSYSTYNILFNTIAVTNATDYTISALWEQLSGLGDGIYTKIEVKTAPAGTVLATLLDSNTSATFTTTTTTITLAFHIDAQGVGLNTPPSIWRFYNICLLKTDHVIAQPLQFGDNSLPELFFVHGDDYYRVYLAALKAIDGESTVMAKVTTVGKGVGAENKDRKADIVQFGNYAFVFNGVAYKSYYSVGAIYNMTNSTAATKPITYTHTSPAGVGTEIGEFSHLTDYVVVEFDGDGATTTYQLPYVDVSFMSVFIDGVVKTSGTHFNWNLALGQIDFASGTAPYGAPATGLNNVVVHVNTDTGASDNNPIDKCTMGIVYSGDNDTRIFCSGNPESPNTVYWSALNDPRNFPITNSAIIGDDTAITGFIKQHNDLIVTKARGIYKKEYEEISGIVAFTQKALNATKGNVARNQLQLVNNNPLVVDKSGIYMVYVSDETSERNVELISKPINKTLLETNNLNKAVCFDYEQQQEYFVCINGIAWVYNYGKNVWYAYSNVNASVFFEYDGDLYYCDDSYGMIYKFDPNSLDDYANSAFPVGAPRAKKAIHSRWESEYYAFEREDLYKDLDTVSLSVKRKVNCKADILFRTEDYDEVDIEFNQPFSTLDFGDVDFGDFSFETAYSPHPEPIQIGLRRFIFLKVIFDNNYSNSTMNVVSMKFNFRYGSSAR